MRAYRVLGLGLMNSLPPPRPPINDYFPNVNTALMLVLDITSEVEAGGYSYYIVILGTDE